METQGRDENGDGGLDWARVVSGKLMAGELGMVAEGRF